MSENVVEVIKDGKALLDEGFISSDEFSFLKQNAISDKPIFPNLDEIRKYYELLKDGLITSEEYDFIKIQILTGKTIRFDVETLKTLGMSYKSNLITDEEFNEFKNTALSNKRVPSKSQFELLQGYYSAFEKGLIEQNDYENVKLNIFRGKSVKSADALKRLEEYKGLLEEGVLDQEEYDQYKESLLPRVQPKAPSKASTPVSAVTQIDTVQEQTDPRKETTIASDSNAKIEEEIVFINEVNEKEQESQNQQISTGKKVLKVILYAASFIILAFFGLVVWASNEVLKDWNVKTGNSYNLISYTIATKDLSFMWILLAIILVAVVLFLLARRIGKKKKTK